MKKFIIHAPMSLSELVAKFQNAIADSEYKEMIKIVPVGTLAFTVTISKVGTSVLSFREISPKRIDNECSVELYKSDISMFHKSSIPAVVQWIEDRVGDWGGGLIPE